jgi:hypothetical protein
MWLVKVIGWRRNLSMIYWLIDDLLAELTEDKNPAIGMQLFYCQTYRGF